MPFSILLQQTAEEKELLSKWTELAGLEDELSQRELELATMKADLSIFECVHLRVVGIKCSELDEIEAQIADLRVRNNPNDESAQKKASDARSRAKESAKNANIDETDRQSKHFTPSDELKKLYREAARAVHPDLIPSCIQ